MQKLSLPDEDLLGAYFLHSQFFLRQYIRPFLGAFVGHTEFSKHGTRTFFWYSVCGAALLPGASPGYESGDTSLTEVSGE